MNRWEIEKKIVMKALKDPEFKKQLISHPKETIHKFLKNEKGFNLAKLERFNIKVIEERRDEWMLAIPYLEISGHKLSDAELEKLFAA